MIVKLKKHPYDRLEMSSSFVMSHDVATNQDVCGVCQGLLVVVLDVHIIYLLINVSIK